MGHVHHGDLVIPVDVRGSTPASVVDRGGVYGGIDSVHPQQRVAVLVELDTLIEPVLMVDSQIIYPHHAVAHAFFCDLLRDGQTDRILLELDGRFLRIDRIAAEADRLGHRELIELIHTHALVKFSRCRDIQIHVRIGDQRQHVFEPDIIAVAPDLQILLGEAGILQRILERPAVIVEGIAHLADVNVAGRDPHACGIVGIHILELFKHIGVDMRQNEILDVREQGDKMIEAVGGRFAVSIRFFVFDIRVGKLQHKGDDGSDRLLQRGIFFIGERRIHGLSRLIQPAGQQRRDRVDISLAVEVAYQIPYQIR